MAYSLEYVPIIVPVLAMHISSHFSVVNTKGLELLKINASKPDSKGGLIPRMPKSKKPNVVLEELAGIP
ncbi:hypothetical protein [Flavobacterium alvei]|uniref:hypothetical protein n=1 Tax=Flavobacterium alvei TaxID=2080416 RepID=UPI0010570247|nr:hypothetical protein [Flavobacterium alvei]